MTVVYSPTLKTDRMQLTLDRINSKTPVASTGPGSTAKLVIGDGTLAGPGATGVLATLIVPNPGFSLSGSVLTLLGVPLSIAASASGTASKAEIRNFADAVIVSGLTVGTGATDVILTSTSITSGQTVTITTPSTITHG
jgi:hypothetical protein